MTAQQDLPLRSLSPLRIDNAANGEIAYISQERYGRAGQSANLPPMFAEPGLPETELAALRYEEV